jgi:hypothetical protein
MNESERSSCTLAYIPPSGKRGRRFRYRSGDVTNTTSHSPPIVLSHACAVCFVSWVGGQIKSQRNRNVLMRDEGVCIRVLPVSYLVRLLLYAWFRDTSLLS